MASQAQEFISTCLICFEKRPLKIVGNCKHSFCTECLSTVFESLASRSDTFACPSCNVDCARPWDGLKGLVDDTGNADDVTNTDTEPAIRPEEKQTECKGQVDVICDVCDDRQIKVQAANTCPECSNLHICTDCSKTHGKNKATRHHLLIPMARKTEEKAMMCKLHHKLLISFCQTCGVEVCNVCVSARHGDHDIERLADTIRANHDVLKKTLELRELKLNEMQELQKELTLLKAMAPMVDKQDTLIKEIEDHAQKCIGQIVKWKEDLKTQVKLDYKIIRDIPECLEKVSEVVQEMQTPINRGNQLLSQTEHHPSYLDRLREMQQDLEDIARTGEGIKGKLFRNQLFNLNTDDSRFSPGPAVEEPSYGHIVKTPKSDKFQPKQIFEHKMQVNSKHMHIPCVVVLGLKFYAVAHPVKPGEQAEAIDIYEFPGTLTTTLKDHVPPLHDMAATPDGKIAVLSNGDLDSTSSVKLFDAVTGYISSTRNIAVAKPLSLGVTLLHQYIILGENEQGQKEITVVDKDENVKHKCVIDQDIDNVTFCTRITCGGRFIFIKGKARVTVYEIHDTGLTTVSQVEKWGWLGHVGDISATIWDNLITTSFCGHFKNAAGMSVGILSTNVNLTTFQDKEHKLEWGASASLKWLRNVATVDKYTRVSTRDGRTVVVSHGHTIEVYRYVTE